MKYVELGKTVESPEKRVRPPRIPDALLVASNLHVTGMQASGDIGESDKSIMIATIDAMFQGTVYEGLFTTELCWRRFWHSYPETLVPTTMFDPEDCRTECLMFKNTNQWIDGAKQILLDIRFVKDDPCTFPVK